MERSAVRHAIAAGRPFVRPRQALLLGLLAVGTLGLAAGAAIYAAFAAASANAGSAFAAGSVVLEDDDGGSAMLALADADPGDADASCIQVRATGSLPATVRLYAATTGSLPQYVTLTVTRGTDPSPAFDSCAGFTPDATDYVGAGPGVVYSGPLASFPATYATGLVDPTSASPETWTTNEAHSYRLAVTLDDVDAAKSLTGTAAFTWEARSG